MTTSTHETPNDGAAIRLASARTVSGPQRMEANCGVYLEPYMTDSKGAPPSNTAPPKYTNTNILLSGFDSLYVSYRGNVKTEILTQLKKLKECSQSEDTLLRRKASFILSEDTFYVHPKGRGNYHYVISNGLYQIQVAGEKSKNIPAVYCQISSEVLAICGDKNAIGHLDSMVSLILETDSQANVSRADLFVDFTTDVDFQNLSLDTWVCRSNKLSIFREAGRFTGLVFGAGGNVGCRIYDKTLEIQKSKKEFFFPLWQKMRWNHDAVVWRLEFQLRGEFLKEANVRLLDDFRQSVSQVWAYCTQNWLTNRSPSLNDTNPSRWPISDLWQILQSPCIGNRQFDPISRLRQHKVPEDYFLFTSGLGSITSFMAREGIDELEDAVFPFLTQALQFHDKRGKTGEGTLSDYIYEKVSEKRTRFAIAAKHGEDK